MKQFFFAIHHSFRWFLSGCLITGVLRASEIEPSLHDMLTSAQRYSESDIYRVPTSEELNAFESFFTACLMAEDIGNQSRLDSLNKQAKKLSFKVSGIDAIIGNKPSHVVVIQETDNMRGGGGIYFLIDGSHGLRPGIIQAPHARSDAHTGKLGLDTFSQGGVSAFFCSTMRRNVSSEIPGVIPMGASDDAAVTPDQDDDPVSESMEETPAWEYNVADPAHQNDGFFQSALKSWMRRYPSSLVIQLHGFKNEKDVPDRNFDLITSCGMTFEKSPPFFPETGRLLRNCFPELRIGLFGQDTSMFGALTNVQGQYVTRFTPGVFLHLEIERAFRDSLIDDNSLKIKFSDCLTHIIKAYEKF